MQDLRFSYWCCWGWGLMDVTLCCWTIDCQRFEGTMMLEMLGTIHPVTQHHTPEDVRPQIYKVCTICCCCTQTVRRKAADELEIFHYLGLVWKHIVSGAECTSCHQISERMDFCLVYWLDILSVSRHKTSKIIMYLNQWSELFGMSSIVWSKAHLILPPLSTHTSEIFR
jgi:hypothetical protein